MVNPNASAPASQVAFYQQNAFNPAPKSIQTVDEWVSHFGVRLNLYQRHLGIPLSLFRDRSVLEFGCNSGENALVLASLGANLTLVEPNDQVLPQLLDLFKRFNLEDRLVQVFQQDLDSFSTGNRYDVVIAEGFVNTLANRDEMLRKISELLGPGGLAVINFGDRYGSLLDMTKRMVLWRACELAGFDVDSRESLELARGLFGDDFSTLNAARPFQVFWKDYFVSPFVAHLWSFPELVPLVEKLGCEFYSSSPPWADSELFTWYKNVGDVKTRHEDLLDIWRRTFTDFLTGIRGTGIGDQATPPRVIDAVAELVSNVSKYTQPEPTVSGESLTYPSILDEYLSAVGKPGLEGFNAAMKRLYESAASADLDHLIETYRETSIRRLWGTSCHYFCFSKTLNPVDTVSNIFKSKAEPGCR